jgi:hypothetical protein
MNTEAVNQEYQTVTLSQLTESLTKAYAFGDSI